MKKPSDYQKRVMTPFRNSEIARTRGRLGPAHNQQHPDRFLWENDDWAVTPAGLQSKWIRQWHIAKDRLLKLRDLAVQNLPGGVTCRSAPFTSALQVALSIHHPDELTIDELTEKKSRDARKAKKFT